jgi:hypothetical protein
VVGRLSSWVGFRVADSNCRISIDQGLKCRGDFEHGEVCTNLASIQRCGTTPRMAPPKNSCSMVCAMMEKCRLRDRKINFGDIDAEKFLLSLAVALLS